MASYLVLRLGLGSPSAYGLHTGQSDLTEYACIRRNRVGGGTARPTNLERPVNGSKPATGAARSAPRARTRVADFDDAPARRLPIDGTRQGCWADQSNLKKPEGGERAESQSILHTVRFSEWPVRSSTGHNLSSRSKMPAPRHVKRAAGAQSSTPAFKLPSGSSHERASAQSKQMHEQLPFTMTGARKITGFDAPHLRHVIGGKIVGPLMLRPLSTDLRLLRQNRLPSVPRTPREKSPACPP